MRLKLAEDLGPRAYIVVFASGVALSFAFPEPDLWFLAWVAIAPVLFLTTGAGARKGALLGWFFGLGYLGVLLQWVSIIGYLGYIVLALLQSSFLLVFGAAWGWLSQKGRGVAFHVVLPAALWVVVVEYLRSVFPLRGFPWGQLAQSQTDVTWFLSTAGLGGSWLTAFLLVAVNAILAGFLLYPDGRRRLATAAGVVACIIAIAAWWPRPGISDEPLKVAIVQGNIPRYMPPSYEKDRIIVGNHVSLTRSLPDDVDLAVWPESSVGIDPYLDPEVGTLISDTVREVGIPMIIGGNLEADANRYQVMAYLYSPEGEIVDRYQKTHLVPFGEYVPARDLLDFIPALEQVPRDAVAGDEIRLFDVDGVKVATAISFEGDFGSLVRERIAAGGRMLIIDTNTSTWHESWASAQHLAMGRLRAAENGVPVVHAALTGVSAFVEPDGSVSQRSGLWESRTLIEDVYPAEGMTPYARFGDLFPLACLVVCLVAAVRLANRRGTVPV